MPRPRLDRWPHATLLTPTGSAVRCALADRPWRRLAGLGFLHPGSASALVLPGCSSVHTVGMRFWIDVAFLLIEPGGRGSVSTVHSALGPSRVAGAEKPAERSPAARTCALELPAGSAERLGLRPGVAVRLLPWDPPRRR